MAAAPPKGGGNVLTRKLGPLPGWAWAAVAVGGYWLYKKRQAAAAAAASPSTTSTAAIPAGASAPSGYGYQGPGVGWGGQGPIPTGATASTAASYTPPSGQSSAGSGYAPAQSGGTVTDQSGNIFTELTSVAQEEAYGQGGGSLYYQVAPGSFQVDTGQVAPGTPLYILSQPAGGQGF